MTDKYVLFYNFGPTKSGWLITHSAHPAPILLAYIISRSDPRLNSKGFEGSLNLFLRPELAQIPYSIQYSNNYRVSQSKV